MSETSLHKAAFASEPARERQALQPSEATPVSGDVRFGVLPADVEAAPSGLLGAPTLPSPQTGSGALAPASEIGDLLLRWEERRAQGQEISVAESCRDCPQHAEEIARRIDALLAMHGVLDTAAVMGEGPGGEPTPHSCPRIPGYEILGELGRGDMGVVYKARHLGLDRLVALKNDLGGRACGAGGFGPLSYRGRSGGPSATSQRGADF